MEPVEPVSQPVSQPGGAPGLEDPAPGVKPPLWQTIKQWFHDYFLGDDPTLGVAYVPYGFLSIALFTRSPRTNFIFDEQEALLANPYVRSIAEKTPKFTWFDAFYRDFWGLGPERSIGSYRPIPNLVWRVLWWMHARDTPFFHHWVNVYLHALNGALACMIAFKLTRSRGTAWLVGAAFTASAVLTEAVSGVVGIADVLGATGALAALLALSWRMPFMGIGVFLFTLFGLYSKETALCCVPLVPLTALLCAQLFHPDKPRRWARMIVSGIAVTAAFVFYVEARRRMFPAAIPAIYSVEANAGKPLPQQLFAHAMRWYAQPSLPKDPLNNPLVNATPVLRVGGALRVYFRGLVQLVFPWTLSGDYSSPQEPIPTTMFSPEISLGGAAMILPFPAAAYLGIASYLRWRREHREIEGPVTPPTRDLRPIIAAGMLWIVISYFPVSNIPALLPTVRAERFWYFPVVGSCLIIGIALHAILVKWAEPPMKRIAIGLVVAFFLFQGVAARLHANDYTDDLAFWDATRKAVPRSAKAHLNYSVMKGARGDLETRRKSNEVALELAPQWPMASVYLGDTLCRLHRAPEAWPHYQRGFELAPDDPNLIALALQCLWDEKMLQQGDPTRDKLSAMGRQHPGSWLDFLVRDILDNGEDNNGVAPKYRPRGYNEGPKE